MVSYLRKTFILITVINKLGLTNVARVVNYKLKLRLGFYDNLEHNQNIYSPKVSYTPHLYRQINTKVFGWFDYKLNTMPRWHQSPLSPEFKVSPKLPWKHSYSAIPKGNDIKEIWELNRFYWITELTYQYKTTSNHDYLDLMNSLISDWYINNPPYKGVNWTCAQEASIRVMHLIANLTSLNKHYELNSNLANILEVHLHRIEPTIGYAIAQDNNHGTSEAIALYIGGAILESNSNSKKYSRWKDLGEKWLINRAEKLIMSDGGTSQYSTNYHRVILDSYCLAEIVRRNLLLKPFPKKTYEKLCRATDWLYVLVQESGDAINLGTNDGARLFPTGTTDYRDYRPTVQLASTIFCQKSYYTKSGSFDNCLDLFNLKKVINRSPLPNKSVFFEKSGIITEKAGSFFIAFKLPIYEFRPSQCDSLHLDVWHEGQNILRDGGTYSYNTTENDLDYFSGVKSHNTIEFDNHLQMPRISRFLFGAWLTPLNLKYKKNKFSCGYKDHWNCRHTRTVETSSNEIKVVDRVTGFKNQAILRWRLMPGNWDLNGNIISNTKFSLEIQSESNITIQLTEGYESKYYYRKTTLPVLEIKTDKPTTITTLIKDLS